MVEARSGKKKTCHKDKGVEITDFQLHLPHDLSVATIQHQNPLYTSVIVGKHLLKEIYFSEPRAFDMEYVIEIDKRI